LESDVANCVYILTRHEWHTGDRDDPAVYVLPSGTIAAVDLRSLVACGIADQPEDAVFCAVDPDAVIDKSAAVLGRGDLRELPVTAGMQDAWESVTGYRPSGDRLVDLLADHLLSGSDPLGQDRCKPLMPTVRGQLEIHLAGHSRVWNRRFRMASDPHANRVQSVLQADYRAVHERDQVLAAKVLDYWCDKYRIRKSDRAAWEKLIPPDLRKHVEGLRKHSTTVGDTFDRADNTDLNASDSGKTLDGSPATWSWTETQNNLAIVSNAVRNDGSGSNNRASARADSDLSSSDNYVEGSIPTAGTNNGRGACVECRYSSSDYTCYALDVIVHTVPQIAKVVAGVVTNLQALSAGWTTTHVGRLEANGSSLTAYIDGSPQGSTTDTAISSGTRCGIAVLARSTSDGDQIQSFEAGDLDVPTGNRRRRFLCGAAA
jgi:hypothetical protein